MTMNPVLEYAIDHQAKARAMLFKQGVPLDDIDDIYQYAVMRILIANPRNRKGPASYWYKTLRTAIADYWFRHHRQPLPFSHGDHDDMSVRDREDPRQDMGRQVDAIEALRQVREICRTARPKERQALVARLEGERTSNATNQRLHRLRRRLRRAVA